MVGQTIGHYRILEKLGAGGMGEVYRAEDTTLNRNVALKILPSELSGSQERLHRFRREAKAVAALNHPNIVTIYSVEGIGGTNFLTMEYIEGQTLKEAVPKNGLELGRFFDISIALADVLSSAHRSGIIHRDLKPGNVMLDRDGRIRVLDFGLAELLPTGSLDGVSFDTDDPTDVLTGEGPIAPVSDCARRAERARRLAGGDLSRRCPEEL